MLEQVEDAGLWLLLVFCQDLGLEQVEYLLGFAGRGLLGGGWLWNVLLVRDSRRDSRSQLILHDSCSQFLFIPLGDQQGGSQLLVGNKGGLKAIDQQGGGQLLPHEQGGFNAGY